jgi:hypothetical protein
MNMQDYEREFHGCLGFVPPDIYSMFEEGGFSGALSTFNDYIMYQFCRDSRMHTDATTLALCGAKKRSRSHKIASWTFAR